MGENLTLVNTLDLRQQYILISIQQEILKIIHLLLLNLTREMTMHDYAPAGMIKPHGHYICFTDFTIVTKYFKQMKKGKCHGNSI